MPKTKIISPGAALSALMEKNGLNPNRLAKAIGMSTTMVSLIVHDKNPVSVAAALRLAKFFKTKPEYWLNLQSAWELENAEKDKVLAKEISGITDVGSYKFVRKPHKRGAERRSSKGKTAKVKTAAKPKQKKATLADKRKKAVKAPGAKPAARSAVNEPQF